MSIAKVEWVNIKLRRNSGGLIGALLLVEVFLAGECVDVWPRKSAQPSELLAQQFLPALRAAFTGVELITAKAKLTIGIKCGFVAREYFECNFAAAQ